MSVSDRDRRADPGDGDLYLSSMNDLVDQAIDYMGRDRAVTIADSAPIDVTDDGEIRGYQFGETEESKRAVTQLVLEAYVQVVGRQLVVNMLQESVSREHLQTFEELCPSDRTAAAQAKAT